jgi:hypothetical protein
VTVIRRFSRAESPAIRPSCNWLMTGSGTKRPFDAFRRMSVLGGKAVIGSIHRTCLSALFTDRALEAWYYSPCMNDPPAGGSHGRLHRTTKILLGGAAVAWPAGDVGRRIYRPRVSRRYAVRGGLAVFLIVQQRLLPPSNWPLRLDQETRSMPPKELRL